MLYVWGCITNQHDLRLVLMAGLLCLFACATAMSMIARAQASRSRVRAFWLIAAGTVAGCGIWGTHFVAMLAFRTGLPVGFDAGLTALSAVIAAVMCAGGFALALRPGFALLGGASTGAAISAMHYVGMSAVRTPASTHWNDGYVAASIIIGVALTTAAMVSAQRSDRWTGYVRSTLLFTLAICGMHFTAMTAVTFVPDPTIAVPRAVMDPPMLALAVAACVILIIGVGLTGALVDNHLSRRATEEARRLRAYVLELEETKRQLEQTSSHLAGALERADAANKAKSEFLASMSHELRTPLNAVIGFSDMMLQETFGPLGSDRYREYIEDIQRSGSHLLALINDVLDLSRLDAGQIKLTDDAIDVSILIAVVTRMMSGQAEKARVTVECDVAPDLPLLRADERRIRQVLINLLMNAIKFTPEGGNIRVNAYTEGDALAITVADSGIGIALQDIPKALERFGQVDSSLSRKYNGAGLGLPLSKQIVELHGGRIELLSEQYVGTTATILLPAERLESRSAAA